MTVQERENLISQRLRDAILQSGYTQHEIAVMVGSSQSQVWVWVRGTGLPGAVKLSLLCEALGVNPAWVLGLSDRREI